LVAAGAGREGVGQVVVTTPEQHASGTFNALTLNRPLNVFETR